MDSILSFLAELGTQGVLYAAGAATGLSLVMFMLVIYRINASVPEEDRAFMDPLPPGLKLFWPVIRIVAYYLVSFFPYEYVERMEARLQKTGVGYLLMAEQYIALRIITSVIVLLLAVLVLNVIDLQEPLWYLFAPLVGYLLPEVWLSDTRKRREGEVLRALPVYLDFITMAVEAGLNLAGALQQAMDKGPRGALHNEFGIVLRDLRSGVTRAEALRRMADRLDVSEITSFVSAVVQAERMGASMAAVLRVQAEQRRNERFQRAEKLAMEAPVKLVGPLIIFIFPVTFVVIAFPIVMKFLAEGLL